MLQGDTNGDRVADFAIDLSGNIALTASDLLGIVSIAQLLPPPPPIYSCLSPVGDDGITNTNTLTLTGNAEANSTIKLYDGATLLGSATVNGGGEWSYTTTALTDGAHSLTATDTDAAGTSAASVALSVLVDTVAPPLAVSGISQGSGGSVTLTGTSEAYTWITIYDGTSGMPLGSATTAADGTWTVQKNGTTATDFTVTSTDLAGNTTQISNLQAGVAPIAAALAVSADTVVPGTSTNASFSTDGGSLDGHVTNGNTPMLTGNADTFVFNLPAMSQPSVTDLTHAAGLLDISSAAAPPHPGIEDYFNAGSAGATPAGLIAGGDADTTAFVVHHPTDFHLV